MVGDEIAFDSLLLRHEEIAATRILRLTFSEYPFILLESRMDKMLLWFETRVIASAMQARRLLTWCSTACASSRTTARVFRASCLLGDLPCQNIDRNMIVFYESLTMKTCLRRLEWCNIVTGLRGVYIAIQRSVLFWWHVCAFPKEPYRRRCDVTRGNQMWRLEIRFWKWVLAEEITQLLKRKFQ